MVEPLTEKILQDFKEAMKSRDSIRVSVISFLRAQMNYAAFERNQPELDDASVTAVVKKLVKQHQDSIEQFRQGGRQDLVEKEEAELRVLKEYLPPEMSGEELTKIVEETVKEAGACGIKDMGKVMKEVIARTGGRADAKTISEKVRERLLKG